MNKQEKYNELTQAINLFYNLKDFCLNNQQIIINAGGLKLSDYNSSILLDSTIRSIEEKICDVKTALQAYLMLDNYISQTLNFVYNHLNSPTAYSDFLFDCYDHFYENKFEEKREAFTIKDYESLCEQKMLLDELFIKFIKDKKQFRKEFKMFLDANILYPHEKKEIIDLNVLI